MQRFYISDQILGSDFSLHKSHDIYYQLSKVLRAQVGDELVFFDWISMNDMRYSIQEISWSQISFCCIDTLKKHSEAPLQLHLYQALPNKVSKIEYILQKAVEVGYTRFVFFRSQRSQKLMLSPAKIQRLNKIIIEAVEQSSRNSIPELLIQENFSALTPQAQHIGIYFHTQDWVHARSLSARCADLNTTQIAGIDILVWPEGGFTPQEVEVFDTLWYQASYLGERILRCETVSSVVGFYIMQALADEK